MPPGCLSCRGTQSRHCGAMFEIQPFTQLTYFALQPVNTIGEAGFRLGRRSDEPSHTVCRGSYAQILQLSESTAHGHRRDPVFLSERPSGRDLVPRAETSLVNVLAERGVHATPRLLGTHENRVLT